WNQNLLMSAFVQDIRTALRSLRSRPGFTTVAVLTLALGLGASVVMFTAVNRLLLDPLPFRDGDRIVLPKLHEPASRVSADPPAALARAWLEDARSFETIEAIATRRGLLLGGEEPAIVSRSEVSPGFLAFLGLAPVLGRPLGTDEAEPVALLGHTFWRREFGGSRDVVGRTIELDDGPRTIIGVMPQRLESYEPSDVWLPLRLDAASDTMPRFIGLAGRLRPGITPEAAAHELEEIRAYAPQPPMFAFFSEW